MGTTHVNMGFIGETNGSLAAELAGQIKLAPYGGSLQGLEGVIVDGQSAAASATSAQSLSAVLESGKTLALANPTAQQLALVRAVTGTGPSAPVALVTYTKAPNASRNRYRSIVVPLGTTLSQGVARETGLVQKEETSGATAPLAPAIIDALAAQIPDLPEQRQGGKALGVTTELQPPLGATYGYSSYQWSLAGGILGGPTINNKEDDMTATDYDRPGTKQYPFASGLNEFYVYYVDGETPRPPYYIVILRQTGGFSPGPGVLANNENSRGWFSGEFQLTGNTANKAWQQPFPNGVTLLGHAPSTYLGPQIPVLLQVPMTLIAQTENGTGPVPFTATVSDASLFYDWEVNDTSFAPNSTSWLYHQVTAWDPTQKLSWDFPMWWPSLYTSDGDDHAVEIPDSSWSNLNYEAVTAWGFDNSLLAPDSRSLYVTFSGGWIQRLYFFHNVYCCLGAIGKKEHDLFWQYPAWDWTWTIDLGQVAQPT